MNTGFKWSVFTLGLLTLSGQVMADNGQFNGSRNLEFLGEAVQQQSQNGNTYRYQKQLGEKPKYQYRHRYQNERAQVSGLSSSGQRRSGH